MSLIIKRAVQCFKTVFGEFSLLSIFLLIVFLNFSGYGGGRGGGGGGGKFGNQAGSTLRKPRWDMDSLPRFEKNFYREHPNVQARSNVSIFTVAVHF